MESNGLRGVSKWVDQGAMEKIDVIIPPRETNWILIQVLPPQHAQGGRPSQSLLSEISEL